MQISLREKKQHRLLGHVLIRTQPELAQQLLDMYTTPEDTIADHTRMKDFFVDFMESVYSFSGSRAMALRTFIASMITCYQPELKLQPRECMIVKRGFVKYLSQVLKQKPPNVSNLIREVIVWEQNYDDFRDNVQQFSSFIINQYGPNNREAEKVC